MRIVAVAAVVMCIIWRAPLAAWAQAGSVAEQYLFAQANSERVQRGLSPLRWDESLYRAAVAHAQEMAKREDISHQYEGELELSKRGKAAGARFSMIAENVAEAPTAVLIHDAWMNSPGHRANLLEPGIDAIGISVVLRDGQLYAVQDFEKSVESLSIEQQEQRVSQLVTALAAIGAGSTPEARRTCSMDTGYAGIRQPWFVMRYTAGDLARLPEQLKTKLASGRYHQAAVGACTTNKRQAFTSYNIAVLLYP